MASLLTRTLGSPKNSRPARVMAACSALSAESLTKSLRPVRSIVVTLMRSLFTPVTAELEHAEALVWTVRVAVTALVPLIMMFGSEKQPFEREGLLDTVHVMVPV